VSIVPATLISSALYVEINLSRKGRGTVYNQLKFRNYSNKVTTQTSNVEDKLNNLRMRAKVSSKIDRNLISLLSNPKLLELAYNNIKSKPGNMTHGVNPETLDGISGEWFNETAQLIKSGKFDFQPLLQLRNEVLPVDCFSWTSAKKASLVSETTSKQRPLLVSIARSRKHRQQVKQLSRRIQIPKASGGTRPLTIGSSRQQIVPEAIRMILEAIYEPTFSDNSHGFRSSKSCHTALKSFYNGFKHAQWLIEGDISKCFDSIDHKKLMDLIEQKVSDRRFTHYINKALKAGFFEFRTFKHNIAGTPQGSIISPLLANIFLHQLDLFIDELKNKFDKGVKPQRNPIASFYERKIARAKQKGDRELVRSLSLNAIKHSYMLFEDPNLRRLMYIRYADDWIIGIRGTAQDAKEILKKVTDYCYSIGLTVSQEKTKITNLRSAKALFLGVELSRSNTTKYTKVNSSSSTSRVSLNLRMTAPITRIIKKLTDTGFLLNGKPAPRFLWLHNNHDQIIHLYNSVFRGYLNYYSFVHNYSRLVSLLNFILKQSAAKLLAAKYKLGTQAKVFKKFGPRLSSPNKIEFIKPSYISNYLNFKVKNINNKTLENIQGLYVTSKSLAILHQMSCLSCGSNYRIEKHPVRKMSDLNPKINLIDRLMVKAHRKQTPPLQGMPHEKNRTNNSQNS
jgi:group II intron reverse transcriptase/maturase